MTLILGDDAYPKIGKREYMQRFEPFFGSKKMTLLRAAYALSKVGHQSQKREDGRRYFDHVRACSWIAVDELHLYDPKLHNTLLLHDIVEDTYLLTVETIDVIFQTKTAVMVNLLTHREGISTAQYVENLRRSERARVIGAKLIDRLHNLRTLEACSPEKRLLKIDETKEFYLPLSEHLIENVKSKYRWRAEYLRDHIQELVDYWSRPNTAS